MTNQYWIVKQEPDSYAWETFARDKVTTWDGVRNYQARNNLKAMRRGDVVLFYASGEQKAVVGLASVAQAAFPDPGAPGEDWVAVKLKAGAALARPVTLAEIKADRALADIALVRNSRLSVQPLPKAAFDQIVTMASS